MWEMATICGKWLKYLTSDFINREIIKRFGKWPKYLGNSLDTSGTA